MAFSRYLRSAFQASLVIRNESIGSLATISSSECAIFARHKYHADYHWKCESCFAHRLAALSNKLSSLPDTGNLRRLALRSFDHATVAAFSAETFFRGPCDFMGTLPIEYAFFGLSLFSSLIRLLFNFFEGRPDRPTWTTTYVSQIFRRFVLRFASFIIGIFILYLSIVASSGVLLDVLIYATITYESSFEVFTSISSSFLADTRL
jgi:hypothetical protein